MQNNPATATQFAAGALCLDANLRQTLPSKEKGTAQDLVPQKSKFSFSLVCLANAKGFGKATYSELTLRKIFWPRGSLTIFYGAAKQISDLIILSFEVPKSRASVIRNAGRVAGKKLSPKTSLCSSELASSACLSGKRLCNANTPGSLQNRTAQRACLVL